MRILAIALVSVLLAGCGGSTYSTRNQSPTAGETPDAAVKQEPIQTGGSGNSGITGTGPHGNEFGTGIPEIKGSDGNPAGSTSKP